MKIKFLSIVCACVLALAMASCGGYPKPTGDVEKDSKALIEKAEGIKSEGDAEKFTKAIEDFDKYYTEKGGEEAQKWAAAKVAVMAKAMEAAAKAQAEEKK